jgi:hypothetical protein
MELTLTTPSILFPAISFIMLAYTNRFNALSSRIRSLHEKYRTDKENLVIHGQISNLRYRLMLVRSMQFLAVMSILLTIICISLIFLEQQLAAKIVFLLSVTLFGISLVLSLLEILKSTNALELELSDMERHEG